MNTTSSKEEIHVITSIQRRRRWTNQEKTQIVKETYESGNSVSPFARKYSIAARLEANLTQVQVARKLGKHQSYISQMESGKRRLLIEDFYILFRLYNKPPEYFYSVFSK
ncbi:hypothetical protein CH370_18790 [Leptospira kmetyi]|uniref:helix-turn-helix domain-containing protein n=1 Tax=Leptospira kmetyi TaxID=408139 RepID=UPI000C29CC7E|nr:helix-turn-helix domain-containing protein [Leptospira kmetyi]PJZ39972.1 hypothetical protein CH370_18790 [Leptospira kmetyi]